MSGTPQDPCPPRRPHPACRARHRPRSREARAFKDLLMAASRLCCGVKGLLPNVLNVNTLSEIFRVIDTEMMSVFSTRLCIISVLTAAASPCQRRVSRPSPPLSSAGCAPGDSGGSEGPPAGHCGHLALYTETLLEKSTGHQLGRGPEPGLGPAVISRGRTCPLLARALSGAGPWEASVTYFSSWALFSSVELSSSLVM